MARSFNGSSDVITANYTEVTAGVSVSVWAKILVDPGVTIQNVIGDINHNRTAGGSWEISSGLVGNTGFSYLLSTSGGGADISGGSTGITLGTWYHVCLTYDSTNGAKAYVNGSSDGTHAANGTLTGGAFTVGIGAPYDGVSRFLNGSAADAAVWNGISLTLTEITALARGIRPYKIRPASLVAWWPLDGKASPEPDLSGFANNGTLTGTALASGPPLAPFTPRWPGWWFPPPTPPTFILMPQIVT